MGMTTVTSTHNVHTVEQSTVDAPDSYSLVNTTEKTVEGQIVDENLLTSQRNIDSRLPSINPKDATIPLGEGLRNNEDHRYWSDINLQDAGLEFDADEVYSSENSVKKRLDKMEFLNTFQKVIGNMITQLITKVAEEPSTLKCSKRLCEKKSVAQPSKVNDTNSIVRQNSINSHQSIEMDNIIRQFVRSDSASTDPVWQKLGMTANHWAAVETDTAQQKHWAIQLEKSVAEAEVKKLYLQKQPDDIIYSTIQRARMANHELNKIQRWEKAGLSNSTPHDPHIVKVLNKLVPTGPATQTQNSSILSTGVKTTPAPLDRLWSVEAELVLKTGFRGCSDFGFQILQDLASTYVLRRPCSSSLYLGISRSSGWLDLVVNEERNLSRFQNWRIAYMNEGLIY